MGALVVLFKSKAGCIHIIAPSLALSACWSVLPPQIYQLVCCSPEHVLPCSDWKEACQLQPHKSWVITKLAHLVLNRPRRQFIRAIIFTWLEAQGLLLFLSPLSFNYIWLVIINESLTTSLCCYLGSAQLSQKTDAMLNYKVEFVTNYSWE